MPNQREDSTNQNPRTYRRTRALVVSEKEAAYLAGLIDGKGTISCSTSIKRLKRQLLWRIRIFSRDKPQLKRIHAILQMGRIDIKKAGAQLTIGIVDGAELARTVVDRSCVKWRHLEAMIAYHQLMIQQVPMDLGGVASTISQYNSDRQGRTIPGLTTDAAIGYLSGLLDARGSVYLSRNRPIVVIQNLPREPLVLIQSQFGGQLIQTARGFSLRWSSWEAIAQLSDVLFSGGDKARKLFGLNTMHQAWLNRKRSGRSTSS